MRTILLFVLVLTQISCRTTTQPRGIWQLAYLTSPKGTITVPATRTLFDFQDDSLRVIDFGNPFTGEWNSLEITIYRTEIRDNAILFSERDETLEFKIQDYSGDSLVLFSDSLGELMTLKRLAMIDGGKVVKSDLVGKSFKFHINRDYVEKLDFVNDSIVLYGQNYRPKNWSIMSYKDYDFLNINYHLFGLFSVNRNDQGSIVIRGNYTKPLQYEFWMETKTNESIGLIGNWIEYERSSYPPSPPNLINYDTLERLKISAELFEFSRFGRKWEQNWHLTNDGKAIYFRNENSYRFQQILELTDSTLVFRKQGNDSLTVKYRKQVTNAQNP